MSWHSHMLKVLFHCKVLCWCSFTLQSVLALIMKSALFVQFALADEKEIRWQGRQTNKQTIKRSDTILELLNIIVENKKYTDRGCLLKLARITSIIESVQKNKSMERAEGRGANDCLLWLELSHCTRFNVSRVILLY